MPERFHQFLGPFETDTFVIIQDFGNSYRLTLDHGPDYDTTLLAAKDTSAFKFRAGNVGEVTINALSNDKYQFLFEEIPLAKAIKGLDADQQASLGMEVCSSIDCTGIAICNDPARPVAKCPGGVLGCYPANEQ